jgi:uncharacterized surface anchored protein
MLSTGDDGMTALENLRYFTYRLQELESPEGYLLPWGKEDLLEIIVSNDKQNLKLMIRH